MKMNLIATACLIFLSVLAIGAQTVIVTPGNLQGWSTADTRPGGAAAIAAFPDGSGGNGSLRLTTNNTTTAKAQFMHDANVPLGDITQLSYSTYQQSAYFPGGDPSYQLPVCLDGMDPAAVTATNPTGCVGFTTFVYEPYENGIVANGVWQSWDVDAGMFWSSRSYSNGSCSVVAGFGGAPFYSLNQLSAACPDAVAVGFGVNIGSNNPSYNVYADFVNFNGTTYNFEMYQTPMSADQCKNGGWMTLKRAGGASGFKNQGDCIQYVNTGK